MASENPALAALAPSRFADAAVPDETRAMNAALVEAMAGVPNWWDVGAQTARDLRVSGRGTFPPPVYSPRARTTTIPGPAGPIALRLVPPAAPAGGSTTAAQSRGVYLHLHGGGWVLGTADQQDLLLERVADGTGLTAVSVEYRLAPEHPYPAAPDDCEAAALWVSDRLAEFGGTALAIGGESAGAHLSALTLLRLRNRHGRTPFRAANLVYGIYDLRMTPSARAFGSERLVLRTVDTEQFIGAFLPGADEARKAAPDVSPIFADLRGLCPALFTVGTRDALVDDTLFMHGRWIAAGNRADLDVHPGAPHGFTLFPGTQATQSLDRQVSFLNAALAAVG